MLTVMSLVPGQVYRALDVSGPPLPATDPATIAGHEATLNLWQAELHAAERAAEVEAKMVAGLRDTLAIVTGTGDTAMQSYFRADLAQTEEIAASAKLAASQKAQEMGPKIAQLTVLIAALRAPPEAT